MSINYTVNTNDISYASVLQDINNTLNIIRKYFYYNEGSFSIKNNFSVTATSNDYTYRQGISDIKSAVSSIESNSAYVPDEYAKRITVPDVNTLINASIINNIISVVNDLDKVCAYDSYDADCSTDSTDSTNSTDGDHNTDSYDTDDTGDGFSNDSDRIN